MSKNSSSGSSVQVGCSGLLVALLTTLFVGLKLTDNIDWSWWWVLSPLWIYAAFFIILFAVVVVILVISELVD